jgi:hypothetical protein
MLCAASLAWPAITKVALEPVADTYISPREPDANFSTSDKDDGLSLLRFDVSHIPASAVVSSALLTLVSAGAQPTKFTACDLSKDFNETQATYRQAAQKMPWASPGLMRFRDYGVGSLIYCSAPGAGPADLTAFVRMAVDTHRKVVNLAVMDAGPIFSRRAADPSKRPKLEVAFDPTAPKAVSNHPFLDIKFASVNLDASASSKSDGSKNGLQYLWTVDRAAPSSTYSPGQELGRDVKLKFEPDVPGQWDLRLRVTDAATKEFSETSVAATDIQLGPHPRLGLNADLISQIKVLQSTRKPVWTRFEDWLQKPTDTKYGSEGQGLLLGYVVTKNKIYFDAAWKLYSAKIYVNGHDRSQGMESFFGACGKAVFCDERLAADTGGDTILQVALLYDWGFDALTSSQRHDLIDWLNAADDYTHAHFQNASVALGLAASAYATYEDNRIAMLQLAWFRAQWETILRSLTSGGAVEEAAAEPLIDIANLVFYASGENLFYSHLFFRRHLAYEAFAAELSALARPNGLAASRRFPNTEEADLFNWVFREKDNDQSADPFADMLYYSPAPVLNMPKRLSFVDPGAGYVYVRNGWNTKAPSTLFKGNGAITSFADNGLAVVWAAGVQRKFAYLRDSGILLTGEGDSVKFSNSVPGVSQFDTGKTFGVSFALGGKSYKVSFSKDTPDAPVIDGMDLVAPGLSNGAPAGKLPAGSKQATVSLKTSEPAACRFSFRAGVTFPYMTNHFQSSDGLTHATVNSELNNGDTYTYFVRCMDKAGNENLDDLRIVFSVAH